ncbi:hypothetical protein [Parasutterella excrementihominis]|uniref:hypothetical protein n=1 Tax=Parasutterella excrementihominis TaxID=487175 RepID=UPI0012BB6311|nr:hypothetical protein [Parasutterella excrementihominis]MTT64672.1 hypothetical protein [Parasutterella excrementihominis]MTT92993.1 hypothetical protein [Parasutterella excrementihominis]
MFFKGMSGAQLAVITAAWVLLLTCLVRLVRQLVNNVSVENVKNFAGAVCFFGAIVLAFCMPELIAALMK